MKALLQHRFFVRLFSCLLCLGLLFAFPLNVSAADSSGNISITDMNIYADETIDTTPSVDGGVVTEDITNELNINKLTSGSLSGYTQINFPATGVDNGEKRLFVSISLTDFIKLNSEHEYTLSYNWVYNVDLTASMNCALRFYDNDGNLLKEQILVAQVGSGSSKNHLVDVSFVPDTKDITSGYKCELFIYYLQGGYNSNNVQRLYISDISLIDNDDDSGWFQKILDAINAIPNNIKSFFTNLGASIKADLGDLGTAIDGFISDLSTDFSGFIDSLGSSISGDLDSQTQAQGGFFENLKLKLQAIGDALTETFENISADFTARFEMFKPRVFEDLHWINAMVNDSSGAVNTKPEVIVKYRAVTSELFYVPSGTVYNFVVDTSLPYFKTFQIYQYYDNDDYCGIFYSTVESSYVSGDVIVLPEGYSYRFCLQLTTSLAGSSSSELSDLCNDYVKLYADEGWLNAFGRLIIKGVTSLFIPSDAFFDDVYARVLDFYESKFGIFAQTTTLFYDVLNVADDVFSTVSYDFVFPEVSVPIAGKNIVVIEETVVDIGFWLENGSFGARLYKIYQLSVWAIIIYCVLKYALRVEDVVFGTSKSISFDDNPKHTQHL